MASAARPPLRVFKDDAHWMKFKAVVASSDPDKIAEFLTQSYRYKEIGEKLDQFIRELIDGKNWTQIRCLSLAMRQVHKHTEFSRVAQLAATILLNQKGEAAILIYRHASLPSKARAIAEEFRQRGWEARAAFLDQISTL